MRGVMVLWIVLNGIADRLPLTNSLFRLLDRHNTKSKEYFLIIDLHQERKIIKNIITKKG